MHLVGVLFPNTYSFHETRKPMENYKARFTNIYGRQTYEL